jgi:hypothetical protein
MKIGGCNKKPSIDKNIPAMQNLCRFYSEKKWF